LFSKVEQTYIPYNNKSRVFLSCELLLSE
jgi:hypothetical protein